MKPQLQSFINFLSHSPTPFQALSNITERLSQAQFTALEEAEPWDLKKGGKYFVTRGGGSIIAWVQGEEKKLRLVGAHTDSPGLKLKPHPDQNKEGLHGLRVEIYGSPLLYTWFDRELSLAGRVDFLTPQGHEQLQLDFAQPLAMIPSLAIHLNREANQGWAIQAQNEMVPLFQGLKAGETSDFRAFILKEVQKTVPSASEIFDFDLFFYPFQAPGFAGLNQEFLLGYRLDNLLSCYAGLQALVESKPKATSILVLNDHEEVGSNSYTGAGGLFLKQVLERITGGSEALTQALPGSLLISCDNAHAVHPNYADKHDPNHGPKLNQGPVIKSNANQRYATHAGSAAQVAYMAKQAQVPLQRFVIRSDQSCGSTLGPITSTLIGLSTVDLGVASLAMHSSRETVGSEDLHHLIRLLTYFYNLKN